MFKTVTGRCFDEAMRHAIADGLTHPDQIKRSIRHDGLWFITRKVPA